MIVENIKKEILRKAEQQPSGFTYSLFDNRTPTRGYVVASNATQNCFGKYGLHIVIKYCMSHHDYCIGGWLNEDGIMQFDASKVFFDINDALIAAKANSQRAIYNLYTGKVIEACDYSKHIRKADAA